MLYAITTSFAVGLVYLLVLTVCIQVGLLNALVYHMQCVYLHLLCNIAPLCWARCVEPNCALRCRGLHLHALDCELYSLDQNCSTVNHMHSYLRVTCWLRTVCHYALKK